MYNAQSFVDMVVEDVPVEGSRRKKERLHFRVASRLEASPTPTDESDIKYKANEITLWPPADAPEGLYDVLCPAGVVGDVQAQSSDRGVVYMVGTPNNGLRALVYLSFDPAFGWEGMKRLHGRPVQAKACMLACAEPLMQRGNLLAGTSSAGPSREQLSQVRARKAGVASPSAGGSASETEIEMEWESEEDAGLKRKVRRTGGRGGKRCKRQRVSGYEDEDQDGSGGSVSKTGNPACLWREEAQYRRLNQGFWLR